MPIKHGQHRSSRPSLKTNAPQTKHQKNSSYTRSLHWLRESNAAIYSYAMSHPNHVDTITGTFCLPPTHPGQVTVSIKMNHASIGIEHVSAVIVFGSRSLNASMSGNDCGTFLAQFEIVKKGGLHLTSQSAWNDHNVRFEGVIVKPHLSIMPPVIVVRRILNPTSTSVHRSCMQVLYASMQGQSCDNAMSAHVAGVIRAEMLRPMSQKEDDGSRKQSTSIASRIGTVSNAMDNEPERPWKISEMSAMANMSRSSFIRNFCKINGQTPQAYLIFRRLEKAAELLKMESCPISHVAERIGYLHESSFCRAFKSLYMQSPTEYRRSG